MDATGTLRDPAQDLRILIWPDDSAMFQGTAAQLKAEGLIPADFDWPKARAHERWQTHGLEFFVRRMRPDGHKGPKDSCHDLDSWCLNVTRIWRGPRSSPAVGLKLVAEELLRRMTAAERSRPEALPRSAEVRPGRLARYDVARRDAAFQAVRLKVPALAPRRRRPRASSDGATR